MADMKIPVARLALFGAAALAIVAVGVGVSRNRSAAPAAPKAAAAAPPQADVDTMISGLEAKLKADPNDAEGWRMLGWAFFETGRFAESATAYAKATKLAPTKGDYWSSLGEALVLASDGQAIPKDAAAAFKRALALDAKDPRARYFLGVEQDMAGNHAQALDTWIALLKDTPAGAPWQADVRKTVEQIAAREKIDVSARLAALPKPVAGPAAALNGIPGPDPQQMAAASKLPSGQQEAMVKGMVDGLARKLAADPRQPDRWMMLIRSRMMLGEGQAAAAALQQAIAANPGARAELVSAAKTLGVPGA